METYGQKEEIAFIEGLGSYRPQEKCLRGYLDAFDKRVKWFEGANPAALRQKAQSRLDQVSVAA